MPLKRKAAARGTRAPRAPSIVGWFFPPPWQEYGAGSVAPPVCPLARVAARAPLAVLGEDVQSDNMLATIPGGRAGVGTAELSPRFAETVLPPHDGRSDSPVQ